MKPSTCLIATATLLLGAACGDNKPSASDSTVAPTQQQLMETGTQQLYQKNDPVSAEATFNQLLALNPTHYGAHYQIAVALDRGGKPAEARPHWTEAARLAETFKDTANLRRARARLAAPDTASQEAMMVLGLDLMLRQGNPAAAAEQFRKILQRNPTHYGATYQLATALDKAGQRAQATPLWQKVLGMAITYKDDKTAQIARERLK